MHNIEYISCPKETDRSKIMADINRQSSKGGDGYWGSMHWHDTSVYPGYEEARQAIKGFDNRDYNDHAVLYNEYPPRSCVENKKIEELRRKIAETREKAAKYAKEHSVFNRTSKMIGCPYCKSSFNRMYLHGEKCPLCSTDLRSDTTVKTLNGYDAKIEEYNRKIEEEIQRINKPTVMWLVKYEYHS